LFNFNKEAIDNYIIFSLIIIVSNNSLTSRIFKQFKLFGKMKRPIYTITQEQLKFHLQLFDEKENLILTGKGFDTFRECEKFLATLRVHLCFQTNFSRSKNMGGQYGFEIRTCWDDLISTSSWFANRPEREDAMEAAFKANKDAIFIHTNIHQKAPSLELLEVA
jgi:hypothetical protein